MLWNEKVDQIKKRYSELEFSVPHVDRKSILRKIETKFINRPVDYYDLNNANERFSNWWENIKSSNEESIDIKVDLRKKLNHLTNDNETFWVVAEFSNGVMVYRANKESSIELITIGQTWTNTFHLVQLKYKFMISIQLASGLMKIKKSNLEMD